MSVAYTRPFHPLDLESRTSAMFRLGDMIEQLRQEEVYRAGNRNALTLLHDGGLTAVLTVVKAGAECEDHLSQEPTLFVVLDGDLKVESAADEGIIYLSLGAAGALARGIRHKITATTECAYLMIIGGSTAPEENVGISSPGSKRQGQVLRS